MGSSEGGSGLGESTWEVGVRLERVGDLPGATAAYLTAIEAGEEPVDPLAVLRWAEILESRNEPAAEAVFRRLAEEWDPAIRAGAWRGISRYRMDRGEVEAALEALQVIVETGDPTETPGRCGTSGCFARTSATSRARGWHTARRSSTTIPCTRRAPG